MFKRVLQAAVVGIVLLTVATAAGYFGMRVGRKFALNQLCCAMSQRQNFKVSVRETLGLVKFPSNRTGSLGCRNRVSRRHERLFSRRGIG